MAKRSKPKKAKPRELQSLPPRPPADLREAVLWGALSEVTPEIEASYVRYIYNAPGDLNKTDREACCRALLMMATVGFSFVNWQRGRGESD